jgi:opacity protein-like surface antigen
MRALLLAGLLALPATAQAAIFDQGPMEPRDFRNPTLARAALSAGVETESLFGFILGADVDPAGSRGLALETVVSAGRRDGRYAAVGSKLEFSYGATDNISVSLGLLAGWRTISGVSGIPDTRNAVRFDGLGTELRWRFLNRETHGIGLTLHVEPSVRWQDETTGEPGRGWGSENKLILDRELIQGRLYGALNLIYDVETFRPHGGATERASTAGLGGGLSWQFTKGIFLGGEIRYLRAYEGLALNRFLGDAVFAGPSLFWRITGNTWLSAAVDFQLAGREAGRANGLELTDFNRMQARIKLGTEF